VLRKLNETTSTPSFDHLIGAGEERGRDRETERAGRPDAHDQFKYGRLLDGYVSRLCPSQNLINVLGGTSKEIGQSRAIRDEPASLYVFSLTKHCWQSRFERQAHNSFPMRVQERARADV
jgi:hypothetical protein